MTFKLGLTGSIGMGKSTTAQMFAEAGCDVWDADAAVHRLYAIGGAAVAPMGDAFPEAIVENAVSRERLRDIIGQDPNALRQIETIVHPLVGEDRSRFISESNKAILVFDIPLLFETGGDKRMDAVACVYVDVATQRQRVLDRGTMNEAQFEQILAKQLPIEEKRRKAEYEIETDTLDHARAQVLAIVEDIKAKLANA
ncbi:MAG: dephospho-CoA kinase [Planktotalea sp.]|uniref:dephospho-CoA kinase n=1 Tax=Planktotalea sp. TaxID=2029877 RepID=UPI003C70B6E2